MRFRGLSYSEIYLSFYLYLAVLTVTISDSDISQRYNTLTTAWHKPLVRLNASPGRSLILCPSVWWSFRRAKGIRKDKTRNCFRSLPREKANNNKKKNLWRRDFFGWERAEGVERAYVTGWAWQHKDAIARRATETQREWLHLQLNLFLMYSNKWFFAKIVSLISVQLTSSQVNWSGGFIRRQWYHNPPFPLKTNVGFPKPLIWIYIKVLKIRQSTQHHTDTYYSYLGFIFYKIPTVLP